MSWREKYPRRLPKFITPYDLKELLRRTLLEEVDE